MTTYPHLAPLHPSPTLKPHGQPLVFVCSFDAPNPSLITPTVPASHLSHSHVATPVCAFLLKISKPHFHHQPTSRAFRHAQTSKAAKDLSSLMCFTPSIPFSDPQTQSPCGTNSLCNLIPIFSTYLTPPVRPPNRRQLAQFTMNTLYTSHCHSLHASPTSPHRLCLPSLSLVLRPPTPLRPLRYPSCYIPNPKAAKYIVTTLSHAHSIPFSQSLIKNSFRTGPPQ